MARFTIEDCDKQLCEKLSEDQKKVWVDTANNAHKGCMAANGDDKKCAMMALKMADSKCKG